MSMMLSRWDFHYRNPTKHEAALEPHIAALGHRYRFQHPIWAAGPAFLDFYWPDLRVAVEVDGKWGHTTPEEKQKDRDRTARLDKLGILVVRVTNGQVDTNPARVAQAARARAEKLRDARPLVSHLPSPLILGGRSGRVSRKRRKGRKGKGGRASRNRGAARQPANRPPSHDGEGRFSGAARGAPTPEWRDPAPLPSVYPDPPYDPAGEAWGGAGVLVDSVSPDFKPRR